MAGTLEASYAHCHRVARSAARNFYYGFLLLPRPKRLALCALYAYMRRVDDLADTPGELETKRRLLADWRAATERALAELQMRFAATAPRRGEPQLGVESRSGVPASGERYDVLTGGLLGEPVWPALGDTLERFRIPSSLLLDVVTGAEMDLTTNSYATFEDLRRYCYCVAGAVGRICAHVFGFSDARAPELGEQMGVAFQLTNILRDLGKDYEMGRVYLPAEDFRRFGCGPEELARSGPPQGALAELLAFQAQRAWEFYEQGWALLPLVNEDSRGALWALARIYSGLLEEIERRRFDVFCARARLSMPEKLAILFWARWGPAGSDEFRQRDRSWRGLGWALLRHRAR